jgi:hypothetical protein
VTSVISDIGLPNVAGYDLMERIRANETDTGVHSRPRWHSRRTPGLKIVRVRSSPGTRRTSQSQWSAARGRRLSTVDPEYAVIAGHTFGRARALLSSEISHSTTMM